MSEPQVHYDVTDGVATVTLNRPDKLNALSRQMARELQSAMMQADASDDVRVIVLTGAGRGFCAGADLEDLGAVMRDGLNADVVRRALAEQTQAAPVRPAGTREDFLTEYSYFPSLTKPVIAAVNGPAHGLGLILALYCDLRFASDAASFSTAFAKRGLIAEYGVAWLLPRLVGLENALDLLFSARIVRADEAKALGLVGRVLPQQDFMGSVREYATMLAREASPRSLRIMKRQVYDAQFQDLREAYDIAVQEMFAGFTSEDFREGVAHFLQKRPPNFTGK